jgi:hypothetical protein
MNKIRMRTTIDCDRGRLDELELSAFSEYESGTFLILVKKVELMTVFEAVSDSGEHKVLFYSLASILVFWI